MSKRYVREVLAADVRNRELWDPATMTEDQAEAAANASSEIAPLVDPAALPKLPVPSDIVLPSGFSSSEDGAGWPRSNTGKVSSEALLSRASAVDLLRALAPEGPWTVRTISAL